MLNQLNTPGGHLAILVFMVLAASLAKAFHVEIDQGMLAALLVALNIRQNQP